MQQTLCDRCGILAHDPYVVHVHGKHECAEHYDICHECMNAVHDALMFHLSDAPG